MHLSLLLIVSAALFSIKASSPVHSFIQQFGRASWGAAVSPTSVGCGECGAFSIMWARGQDALWGTDATEHGDGDDGDDDSDDV